MLTKLLLTGALVLGVNPPAAPVEVLAPGVEVWSVTLGQGTGHNSWTVTVAVPSSSQDPDAPPAALGTQDHAQALVQALSAKGFAARAEEVDWPAFADSPRGALGWRVRVGSFSSQAAAASTAAAMKAAGFTVTTEWTGQDGPQSQGPEHVKVAVVDPRRFTGQVVATHGPSATGRRTTSSLAAAAGALVGVNGGFFVIDPADGIPGEAAGLGVYDGQLQSEATDGRVELALGQRPSIGSLRTQVTVNGMTVNGVNRKPGIIRNCGEPGDQPTSKPLHDTTCANPNELVLFTPQLGTSTPAGDGVQAVLDAHGVVTALQPRGGDVPANGHVLQGIGTGAAWLSAHAQPGAKLRLDSRVVDQRGRTVQAQGVLNGGPWLVRDGRVSVDAVADGVSHPGDPSYLYGWAIKRNPRTMVGLDRSGRLIIVTVDGRQPGYSEGFSVLEGARMLAGLGAVQAMNLDGGGSTAMAVNGKLVTSPSDATGERPIGDALLILPH
ncbi:phosphodiester glycosidase family protein [Kutzneria sp. CA-103260]|uniref:phosphodiester glycosidase family protein n=1 Tax=Kutzneria sp. CA-103260 TaxID=2802641 RepID=UPI001BA49219|nr:phosphodiester glycosidase family protein [Kutzneria sp. CA-103260]QUQ71266.1 Phosphodiester glycosidase [Kutzneria sp. CA-103260]